VVQQDVGDSGSHEVMEVIGELDPQTGVYSIHQPAAAAVSAAGSILYAIHGYLFIGWSTFIIFLLELES
jgi:hypothetical protein